MCTKNIIDNFDGDYAFLSNFAHSFIISEGIGYPTVEHAFQAYKTKDREERLAIAKEPSPGKAKRAGRRVTLRDDWETIKDEVMEFYVRQKFFTNENLKKRLLETGEAILIEGNTWHDNYWGSCSCDRCATITGQNNLGKILMKVRREIQIGDKNEQALHGDRK